MKTRKSTTYLMAATLAIGGLGYCATARADTSVTQTQTNTPANDANTPANDQTTNTNYNNTNNPNEGVKDTHSVNSVREQIKEITDAALTKNDLEAIRNRLTIDDQKRLGDIKSEDSDDLNNLVKDIDQKWKDRYGHKFDMDEKVALAEPFVVINSINNAQVASSSDNSDKTRETANVTIRASHDMPELNLTMLREHASWKLQLPSSVDGAMLKSNLMAQLQQIDTDSAKWPSDENEAYRIVTHRVMMGITGAQGTAQPAAASNMP